MQILDSLERVLTRRLDRLVDGNTSELLSALTPGEIFHLFSALLKRLGFKPPGSGNGGGASSDENTNTGGSNDDEGLL